MSRKSVGYFDGTDSAVLTSLICDGYDTLPISNGTDGHGMPVRQFNEENKTDILVGYLHKIYAPVGSEIAAEDMFRICQTYQVPFLVIVPKDQHERARAKLDIMVDVVKFVDPGDLLEEIRKTLS